VLFNGMGMRTQVPLIARSVVGGLVDRVRRR
jgi:hypothetical protein